MCKCRQMSLSVVVFLVANTIVVSAFNVDTVNYAKHRGEPGSMFGFSIATHKTRGTSWVLVGAPEAQTSQPQVIKGGAVFRCTVLGDDNCQELPFDRNGDNVDTLGRPIDKKSFQWFGATLFSAGEEKSIVACAPRYVWFTSKRDRRDPVGTCFVSRGDFGEYSEYSPCRTSMWGYHRQGSCQAGFSAGVSEDSKNLFIGAPGSWYWQGQMYSIDAHAKFPFTPGLFGGEFGSQGQVIRQSLENRPAVVSTREGPEHDDDSYLGYSLAVGDFTGAGSQGVAVGMPRGASLKGKVVIFTWNLTNHQNITGEQLGAYFGYAVAACDVDGDGSDDLVIGAPLFTEPNNEGKYEVGRVYVVYQSGSYEGRFRRLHTLDGTNSKSRFGLSLASLGDINLDGYGDFAVGAPYDGPNERGAVYIFHGSEDGVRKKYSQVIFSEDISRYAGGRPIETFGWSLSGGLDLDENDYPDMAVGAYLSDTAFFFRSRPVVKIDAQLKYLTPGKQIILEEKNCTLRNGQRVPCTSFNVCMAYKGLNVPSSLDFNVQYILDSKKTRGQRMFFRDLENRYVLNETWSLRKDDSSICRPKMIYLSNEIRDKLTPLEVEIHYSMLRYDSLVHTTQRDPRSQLYPILDLNLPTVRKDSISVHKNCGNDNICIPNLRLIARPNVQKYLLGSNEKLEFDITVPNEGEDSFESMFQLELPPGIDFIKVIEDETNEVRILCSQVNNTIKCDIGNPLPANKIVKFKVQLQPTTKEGMNPSYDFTMIVNSTNPETKQTMKDNRITKSIHIWVDSKLSLEGTSRPADVHYNYSTYKVEAIQDEKDIGPQVIHVYSIRNDGPSSINEAEIFILWPFTTLAGDDLLYLLEQPQTLGNIKCEPASANYKHYGLEYKMKTIWETLGIDKTSEGLGTASASVGKVALEEGKVTFAEVGGSRKKEDSSKSKAFESGDASLVHEHRHKDHHEEGAGSGEGNVVQVLEDTGKGSKTIVTKTHWVSSSVNGGPPVNKTYTHTETYYGTPENRQAAWGSSLGQSGHRIESGGSAAHGSSIHGSAAHGGATRTEGSYSQSGSYDREHSNSGSTSYGESSSGGSSYNNRHSHSGTGSYDENTGGGSSYDTGHSQSGTFSYSGSGGGGSYNRAGSHSGSVSGGGSRGSSSYDRESSRTGSASHSGSSGGSSYNSGSTHGGTLYGGSSSHDRESGSSYSGRVGSSYHQTYEGGRGGGEMASGSHTHEESYGHGDRHFVSSEEDNGKSESKIGIEESGHSNPSTVYEEREYQLGYGDVELQRRLQAEAKRRQEAHGYHETYGSQEGSRHEGNFRQENRQGHTLGFEGHQDNSRTSVSSSGRDRSTYGKYNHSLSQEDIQTYGIGTAALSPGGFKTTGIELGPVQNVDKHMDEHARTTFEDNLGVTVYGSNDPIIEADPYGSQEDISVGGQAGASNTYSSSAEGSYGRGYERRYETSYSSGGSYSSPNYHMHHREVGRDNVPTDKPTLSNPLYRRKRQANDVNLEDVVECKATRCIPIKCTTGLLLKDQEALIALRSRVNVHTLRNISVSQSITFSSKILARISRLPYIGKPLDRQIQSHEIFTTVSAPEPEIKPDTVPLWVVVLSAVAGTIILLLLVFLLYKCGFFKRNRPSDAPERQPLNRNGHFQHGDEAL